MLSFVMATNQAAKEGGRGCSQFEGERFGLERPCVDCYGGAIGPCETCGGSGQVEVWGVFGDLTTGEALSLIGEARLGAGGWTVKGSELVERDGEIGK